MYKVIKHFTDLQDENFAYHVGDDFPRDGMKVSSARIEELSSNNNKRGVPVIEFVEEPLPFTEGDEEDPIEEPILEEKPKAKRSKKKG